MQSIGEFNEGERELWLLHSKVIRVLGSIMQGIISREQENQSDLMIEDVEIAYLFPLWIHIKDPNKLWDERYRGLGWFIN